MQIEELRTLVTLAEVKNFTKTAEIRLMSQPTVSLHIKNLEQEFQTELFQRSPKFLNITPNGQLLVERAKQIIDLYEQAKRDILELHEEIKGTLRIGASYTIGEYLLPSLLSDLQRKYQKLEIEVVIGNTEEIVDSIRQFKLEIGLIDDQMDDKELEVIPFMDDQLVILASPDHPLARKSSIDLKDLHNQSWITQEMGSGTRELLMGMLDRNGLSVKSMLSVNSTQVIKECVKNGLGLSLLSVRVIARDLAEKQLSLIQVNELNFSSSFSYIYSPVMQKKKNVQAFIEAVDEKWKFEG